MTLNFLDNDCKLRIKEALADPNFDKALFIEWLERRDVQHKNNPSAFFMSVFPKELAKGTFRKKSEIDLSELEDPKPQPVGQPKARTVEEYLHKFEVWVDFPEPVSDEDEMNQDEAHKIMWEGAVKSLGGGRPFHEPIPADEREEFLSGFYPVYLRDDYRRHPEYFENTWIAVYRESRERGEPMRKTCERKGLKVGALIV